MPQLKEKINENQQILGFPSSQGYLLKKSVDTKVAIKKLKTEPRTGLLTLGHLRLGLVTLGHLRLGLFPLAFEGQR